MGLQRSPSYKQNVQPIKKTTNDENKDNGSINMRTPYLSVPTTNEPFFDSSYNSWVVSFFSIFLVLATIVHVIEILLYLVEFGFSLYEHATQNLSFIRKNSSYIYLFICLFVKFLFFEYKY
jgi:hypothetical protein